jgi:catecholate siderophore receptor
MKHTLLTGLELARERLDRSTSRSTPTRTRPGRRIPPRRPRSSNPDPSTLLSYTKVPNVRSIAQGDTLATFAQDQIEFSEKWKALVGLRWERYEAEARNESYATGVVASGPFSRTDRMTSARGGLIYQPTGTQSYYISAGNSYNPSGELGVYGQNGTNLNPTNEDLAPEKNLGYELGGTWDFADGLQVRAALFRNEKTNARKLDEVGATVLTGKRRVEGLELQFAGYILPNWEVYSGVAFMRGEIVSGPPTSRARSRSAFPISRATSGPCTSWVEDGKWVAACAGPRASSSATRTTARCPAPRSMTSPRPT